MKYNNLKFKWLLFIMLSIVIITTINANTTDSNTTIVLEGVNKVDVYFFWGEGCPHCHDQLPFIEGLKDNPNVNVYMYETWNNKSNVDIFKQVTAAYGVEARGVPATFIGDKYWFGYGTRYKYQMQDKIDECINVGCVSPLDDSTTNYTEPLCIHLFVHSECSQCISVEPFIENIVNKYNIELSIYNVENPEHNTIYQEFKSLYGLEQAGHPIIFMGDRYLIGEKAIRDNLETQLTLCIDEGCVCPIGDIKGITSQMPKSSDYTPDSNNIIDVPLIGEVDLSNMSLWMVTFIISFIDGFNPCSLWVLMFLLGIVIHTGSRRKIIIVGLTFLFVTATAYGVFMLGILNVFLYVQYLSWIIAVVALFALTFAIINIKDYFWYKKGFSLTISDKYKPKIFKGIRNVMKGEKGTFALIISTTVMALGIVLVELPCTAGFPVIWIGIIGSYDLGMTTFALLFLFYIFIYLILELIIFFTVVFTLKVSRFEEKHGRILKLVGGIIMLSLGLVLLFDHQMMNDIKGALMIFAVSFIASIVIIVLHRMVLPKFGINIGSKTLTEDIKNNKNPDNNVGNVPIDNGKDENNKE